MRQFSYIMPAAMLLAGCSTSTGQVRPAGPATVNPASLAAAPAQWNGREVEVVGVLVWEFERLGLYQSYGAYCRSAEKSAIAVDWQKWPGVTKKDNRRRVVVRGTFTNVYGGPSANGAVIVSNGAPGPGPLEPGSVVRWLSAPEAACPKALP